MKNNWAIVVLVGFCVGVGYIIGVTTSNHSSQLPPINGVVEAPQLVPYLIESPFYLNLSFPDKTKNVKTENANTQNIDTMAIIADYILRSKYKVELFDNKKYGKLAIDATVHLNRLEAVKYDFTPPINNNMPKKISPFITSSVNSFGAIGLGGGVFVRNTGVGVKYITDTKKNGIELSIIQKF